MALLQGLRARLYARRMLGATLNGHREGLDDVEAYLRKNAEPLKVPFLLISQVQRSGGTLLSQLFDGHSQVAAHADELRIGHPSEENWPKVDPQLGAEENFRILFAEKTSHNVGRGYTKGGRTDAVYPFFLIPRVQYRLFRHFYQSGKPQTARDILDLYFTSYFNAWLNYGGSLAGKRWITAFAPRMAEREDSVEGFFRDYPDGRLIQILREPSGWYLSARNHRTTRLKDKSADQVVEAWVASTASMARNVRRFGDKVTVLRFEDLVGSTEKTMRHLSQLMGIDFEPSLLSPTYLGRPMWANSSFAVEQSGVIAAPIDRSASLSSGEKDMLARCRDTYDEAAALALDLDRFASAHKVA